ncbi:PepSY domain-containing protein [Breznakiella homolactica]|uniref:PepSY domain-containing protein n=1 Tax=Breznakiella homolactica TaxID=2798577 RepID=A0A7T7XM51_9SPIR|nr:PepSY domain-containing protein [Breznakiella homolactica]QQO08798.1 PepSY domain-containing protein [Breznakiella homolactica]
MSVIKKAGFAVLFFSVLVLAGGSLFAQGKGDIGLERAEESALAEAGGGTVVHKDQFRDRGIRYYKIVLVNEGLRYYFEIGADDGRVYTQRTSPVRENIRSTSDTVPAISEEAAVKIALERTGDGTVTESRLSREDDGILIYEIKIAGSENWYKTDIDAVTGDVIFYERRLRDRR